MRHKFLWLALIAAVVTVAGCTPRVRVTQSPGPSDTGIRYYRPKPYLRIEPAGSIVTEGKVSTTTPSDEFVSISLEYLPDFSEEYSIDVRPGLGTANVSIGLTDGWNLTSLNQELDSKFDENIKAVAELAKAASGFVPSAKFGEGVPSGSSQKFVVASTNIPIGYYESVISKDGCGKKRLYGWRYVGFLPFSPCPIEMCGSQHLACHNEPSDLFGIVFENGVMTFKRLGAEMEFGSESRTAVSTGQFILSESNHEKLVALQNAIKRAILVNDGIDSHVQAKFSDDAMTVELDIELLGPIDKSTKRERFVKKLIEYQEVESALAALGNPIPSIANLVGLQ